MNILEELWRGNIDPQGQNDSMDPQIKRALVLVVKNKEQLEKLSDCQSDLTDLLELKAFTAGFRLAVKIMADVMSTIKIPSVDG